jgi:hypothetical protein
VYNACKGCNSENEMFWNLSLKNITSSKWPHLPDDNRKFVILTNAYIRHTKNKRGIMPKGISASKWWYDYSHSLATNIITALILTGFFCIKHVYRRHNNRDSDVVSGIEIGIEKNRVTGKCCRKMRYSSVVVVFYFSRTRHPKSSCWIW